MVNQNKIYIKNKKINQCENKENNNELYSRK